MRSRDHTWAVWVDLGEWLGRDGGAADGIAVDQPAPGGLIRWIRTSGGTWVGVVNVIITMTDGSTVKYAEQLIPARALRPR
jgi:hypothetical protein